LTSLETLGLSLFLVVLLLGLFATVFGFPGTLIIALAVFLYATITGFANVGFLTLLLVILLSLVAEVIDFASGMYGTVRLWSSNRDFFTAIAGSTLGAIALTPLLLGFGILLGIFLGGFTALLLVRLLEYRRMRVSLRPPGRVIVGRAAAVLVKGGSALTMIAVTLLKIYS